MEVYPLRLTRNRHNQLKRVKALSARLRKLPHHFKLIFEDDILTACENRLKVLERINHA